MIPREGYPAEMERGELVRLVREVLGEIKASQGSGMMSVRLGPTTRSLRIRFMLEGRKCLADVLVPLPAAVAEMVPDMKRNPWGMVEAQVEAFNTEPSAPVVTLPTSDPE